MASENMCKNIKITLVIINTAINDIIFITIFVIELETACVVSCFAEFIALSNIFGMLFFSLFSVFSSLESLSIVDTT